MYNAPILLSFNEEVVVIAAANFACTDRVHHNFSTQSTNRQVIYKAIKTLTQFCSELLFGVKLLNILKLELAWCIQTFPHVIYSNLWLKVFKRRCEITCDLREVEFNMDSFHEYRANSLASEWVREVGVTSLRECCNRLPLTCNR